MSLLLQVRNLEKHFPVSGTLFRSRKLLKAVDNVSFDIQEGETVGLVGESGCGKTTTGRLVLRLLEPTRGEVWFKGVNIYELSEPQMKALRREMQIIFQDPYASLNPRHTVFEILQFPFRLHEQASNSEAREKVRTLLSSVGLIPPEQFMLRYPHQLSGGQRQRIVIARAIALRPSLVVADEPVSSLDLSSQAQILKLLRDIAQQLHMSFLFISHDLGIVRFMSRRVAVMYLGRIVELADVQELFSKPLHPYTEALLSAEPTPDPALMHKKKRVILHGDPPSLTELHQGCRFYSRCPVRMDVCRTIDPALIDIEKNHYVACHLHTRPA